MGPEKRWCFSRALWCHKNHVWYRHPTKWKSSVTRCVEWLFIYVSLFPSSFRLIKSAWIRNYFFRQRVQTPKWGYVHLIRNVGNFDNCGNMPKYKADFSLPWPELQLQYELIRSCSNYAAGETGKRSGRKYAYELHLCLQQQISSRSVRRQYKSLVDGVW